MISLNDPSIWSKASEPTQVHREGDLIFMIFPITARMDIIYRSEEELFSQTIRKSFSQRPFLCAINGMMYSISFIGYQDVMISGDPIPAKETKPDGYVLMQSKVIGGRSAPQMFYVVHDYLGGYNFGQGDPPLNASRGMGGLTPIIINGLPYGIGNRCKRAITCPSKGPIPTAAFEYVEQRNNNTYEKLQNMPTSTGKVILATNKSQGKFLVIAQANGRKGTTYDDIKASLLLIGCDNAVAMDGSDSAMFWTKGHALVSPGPMKDETNTMGIAFYL